MTDTYSKLLGLSGNKTPPSDQAKPKPSPPLPMEQKTRLLANQQTSKPTQPQPPHVVPRAESASIHTPLSPAQNPQQVQEDTSFFTTKEKTKYGTYLTDESIQQIRIHAIQTNRDDHQIIQEAVNQYFERLKK